jgi:protein-disulfide isomerase
MSKLIVPPNKEDHIQGDIDKNVTLVEYGDFECPHCGAAYPIVKEIQKIEGDSLAFIFRNFPLSHAHPHALHAAYAAESAGKQNKYWEMHDLLLENQDALEDEDLKAYAEKLNLDIPQFLKDMESEEIAKKVQDEITNGARSGVNGTPTFFINNIRFDGPSQLEPLLKDINLAKKKNDKKS